MEETSVCKIIIVGNGSAGKTSICARFKDDGFQRVYKQTIGIDWYEKTLDVRGRRLVLQVWDIGGQSISSGMMSQYIFGVGVVFLVYDITDEQSFMDLEDWWALVTRTVESGGKDGKDGNGGGKGGGKGGAEQAPAAAQRPDAYLVGNKMDLEHLRKVPVAKHDAYIRERRLRGGFFISARSGENVLLAFYAAAARRLGIELTPHELELVTKVLTVTAGGGGGGDEGRTAAAAAIEAEDAAAEARKKAGCCVIG